MTTPTTDVGERFYVTGGTLPPDAGSYVVRRADTELVAGLRQGEFCYVLNTRQMGKSSLMIRAARQLSAEGVAVVVLDLTAIGQNLNVSQWYYGLVGRVGEQLGIEEALEDCWLDHSMMGPLQRFITAVHEALVLLDDRPLVIFVDEIDAVRSLPFSADEFFIGIRECYNRRTLDPTFHRLTFCLLGVATPSDLIADSRLSPFNIGHRIELRDFTAEEAATLAAGLHTKDEGGSERAGVARNSRTGMKDEGQGLAHPSSFIPHPLSASLILLNRVLYWTAGHPNLTQRLCRAVARQIQTQSSLTPNAQHLTPDAQRLTPNARRSTLEAQLPEALVDRVCREMFLTQTAQETDDNLAFVRNRLIKSDVDLTALLELYSRVRAGRPVRDDETNPLCAVLRLSGVVKAVDGRLTVRNEIYARVFNENWILALLPGAELRRQRRAYRLGLLRAAGAASVIILALGALSFVAISSARRAYRSELAARAATARAAAEADHANRLLYDADCNLAQQTYDSGDTGGVLDVLAQMRPAPGHADLRGFEWYYFLRLCHQGLRTLKGATQVIQSLAYSPDGKTLAVCDNASAVRLWEPDTGRLKETLSLPGRQPHALAYAPDGKVLAITSGAIVDLWGLKERRVVRTLRGHGGNINSVAFSPDGRRIASGSADRTVKLWNVADGRALRTLTSDTRRGAWAVAFSPDGSLLAAGNDDKTAHVWDSATGRLLQSLKGHNWYVYTVAFSPDSRTLATAGGDGKIVLWNPRTGKLLRTLRGHNIYVYALAFSPDGKTLASGSWDDTVRLWNPVTGEPIRILRGHTSYVFSVAFSPDSRRLASGSNDHTVKIWDTLQETEARTLTPGATVLSEYLSPQGRLLGVDRSDHVRDLFAGRTLLTLTGEDRGSSVTGYSRDGRWLTTLHKGLQGGAVWDVGNGRPVRRLPGPLVALVLSPDGQRIATVSTARGLEIIDSATGRILIRRDGFGEHVAAPGFSQDGQWFALSDGNFRILIVHIGPAAEPQLFAQDVSEKVSGAARSAFTPDNRRLLISSNQNRYADVLDIGTRQVVAHLSGHTDVLSDIACSPDGLRYATGSLDGTVRLWDAATSRLLLAFQARMGQISLIAFSADGRSLVAIGTEGGVKVWDAASDAQTSAWETENGSEGP